ncbi:MAG: hypothetical protein OXN80_06440 [bacterium]|nr:hypothetical protein [bacterium]
MEWLIALAIVAGNTITVLIVQLFGNRRQKAETEFSIVQAQHVVLKDLYAALERSQQLLEIKEQQLNILRQDLVLHR